MVDLMRELADMPKPIDATRHAAERLIRETERWLRMAIEKGPGWGVWRSHPTSDPGVSFTITHLFALTPPGTTTMPAGLWYRPPDLTDGERVRLLAGRADWQEDRWQDECGVPGCDHDCCAVYWGHKEPTRL